MSKNQSVIKLDKFLSYVLGRKPDEFGLVPDRDGYVKIKELLKAISEEEGWKHIRRASIDEILITLPCPSVEVKDPMIRASEREQLFPRALAANPPRLLYTCVRQKAHPHVFKHGLLPLGQPEIILAKEPTLAEKIGKRIDSQPVTLTVHVQNAVSRGVIFEESGSLFLTSFIPPECITGPPLPKEKIETKKPAALPVKNPESLPGGFFLNLEQDHLPKSLHKSKQKQGEPSWKKDRKHARKQKQHPWSD